MENLYDVALYDELLYDQTGDFDLTATAAGNKAALKSQNLVKTVSTVRVALKSVNSRSVPATAALKKLNNARTASATVALKSINRTRTVTPVTAALKAIDKPRTSTPVTVALRSTKSRVVPATVALKSIAVARSIAATASITFGFVTHQARAKGNTVSLKGYTVFTEIYPPVGVLVEAQPLETSIVEFNMLGLGAVTSLEAVDLYTTTIVKAAVSAHESFIEELGVRAHEALYDTQLYDVPMYDETEAVPLYEQETATCGIEALSPVVIALIEQDTWTASNTVSDIIDTSITEVQRPTATIGSV